MGHKKQRKTNNRISISVGNRLRHHSKKEEYCIVFRDAFLPVAKDAILQKKTNKKKNE
jgi:hypothetical protein